MATNNVNRITLKISTVFDKTGTLKEAQKLQNALDKQSEATNKKREKGINSVTNAQNKNNNAIKDGSKATKSLGKNFADAFKKAVKGFIVLQLLLAITTQLRRAVELAFLIDKAFTNFAIVSKATASEIAQVDTEVGNLTKRLGALKAEVINTVTEFSRAGFSIQESLQLAETAIIGANVGMTSLEEVTTFLVAGLKAFRLEAEESTRILDVLFRVANTTAIDLSGIGEAFLRSANTLNTAGASLEESAALIAAANESIQNPAKIGSALNTIASRLRGVGVEGEAIPKLAESFRQVGIEIQNADGSFRDIFTIFEEFANIYEDLDEITRESLLEKLAGKRQKNVLIGLLTNFETAKQAVEDASNSAGESAQAQEKFLQSLEGQAKLLKDAWNSLLETLRDSGALEVIIKVLTGIANGLTFIVKEIPILITGISALTLQFVAFGVKAGTAIGFATGGISILVGLLATVAQGFVIFGDKTAQANERIAEATQKIKELRGELDRLENINSEDRTKEQEQYIALLKEQLAVEMEIKKVNEEKIFQSRRDELDDLVDDVKGSVKIIKRNFKELEDGNIEEMFISDYTDAIQENRLELLKNSKVLKENREAIESAMEMYDEGTTTYEEYQEQLDLIDETILSLNNTYETVFGVSLDKIIEKEEDLNDVIEEQQSLLKQVQDLTSTGADDYEALQEALSMLTEEGFLTDEMLSDLVLRFGDIITETGLTADAFEEYAQRNKLNTLSEINRLRLLAESEIRTAKAILSARQSLNFDSQGFSTASAGSTTAVESAIRDAENSLGFLDNFERLLLNTSKASDSSSSSTSKQTKILTELERALNEVNFQIELQQKLLSRTDIPSEQIKINETLIDLYRQQKQVLIEQQAELESQRGSVVKGTEAYDDFIDKSYELSLAIEDSTNNIYDLEQANRELNKAFQETEVGELEEGLKSIADSIQNEITKEIARIKDLAKLRAESLKNDIEDEKIKLQALKDANSEKEEQIKLEQLLINLQDLRERRQNILNNKNVRIVKDANVGFENIADPREIRAVGEQIIDAEKAIADFRREQVFNEEVRKLEITIESLEKQAKAEQESYDDRVELLETFQDRINEEIELGGDLSEGLVDEITNQLESIEQGSYTARLGNLQTFIGEYNSKMATLNDQRADLQDIQDKIKTAQENIQGLQSAPTINSSSTTGNTISSTPSSASLGNNISSNNTNTTNSNTSIGSINVNTNANTLDGLIKDARRQTPLLSKN